MSIPDAAIEAAAEEIALKVYGLSLADLDASEYTDAYMGASSAIEAALPAIREAIANELHAAMCTDPTCSDVCAGAANAVEVVLEGFEL